MFVSRRLTTLLLGGFFLKIIFLFESFFLFLRNKIIRKYV